MAILSAALALALALAAALPAAGASQLLALRKLPPDAGLKIPAHHLAFARDGLDAEPNGTWASPQPAYDWHLAGPGGVLWHRAALLGPRAASCPAGMDSCAGTGAPHKCCPEGSYCADVPDDGVGRVACCPRGARCGGQVAACPPEAVACPQALGGGCCIPGYACRGFGCVPDSSASLSQTAAPPLETATSTRAASTSVASSLSGPDTTSTLPTVTASSSTSAASSTAASTPRPTSAGSTSATSSAQTGCPTGFYGCLATHGGGCCRTDRDCATHSCPPAPSSTTIAANGATIVVPAGGAARAADATPTCAGGWFLCGASAGPAPGCCPGGYECGTASCFATAEASQTGRVQKEPPRGESAAGRVAIDWAGPAWRKLLLGAAVGACLKALA